jgi:hypothetical protein
VGSDTISEIIEFAGGGFFGLGEGFATGSVGLGGGFNFDAFAAAQAQDYLLETQLAAFGNRVNALAGGPLVTPEAIDRAVASDATNLAQAIVKESLMALEFDGIPVLELPGAFRTVGIDVGQTLFPDVDDFGFGENSDIFSDPFPEGGDGDADRESSSGFGGFLLDVLGGTAKAVVPTLVNAAIMKFLGNDEPERPMVTMQSDFAAVCRATPGCSEQLARGLAAAQISPCAGKSGIAGLLCEIAQANMGGIGNPLEGESVPVNVAVGSISTCEQLLGGLQGVVNSDKKTRSTVYKGILKACGSALTAMRKKELRKVLKLTTRRRRCATPKRRRVCAPKRAARKRSCGPRRRRRVARKTCGSGCPPKKKSCRKTATQSAFARLARQYGGRIPKGTKLR